jgi:hypothetical protein
LPEHLAVIEAASDQALNSLQHPGHDRLQLNTFFSVKAFFFADVIDEAGNVRSSSYMDLCFIQS